MSEDSLAGLLHLKYLTIEQSWLEFPPNIDYVGSTLVELQITKNVVTHIPNDYFQHSTALESVYFWKNKINNVPNLCYIKNTLEILDLSENRITYVGSLLSCDYGKLTTIKLSDNLITALPLTCKKRFSYWPQVDELIIERNKLLGLPGLYCDETWGKDADSVLLRLYAKDNPYHCDASLEWLVGSRDNP